MNCEKCGRPEGAELKECSYRKDGACPYEEKTAYRSLRISGCALFAGLVSVSLSLWMLTIEDLPLVIRIILWGGVILGALAIIGGLIGSFLKERVIYHQDGERAWREVSIMGKVISQAITYGFRKLAWSDGHIRKIRFPASVVELARGEETIPIVSTALTHLLSTGVIEVGVVSSKGTMGSSKEEFFFMSGTDIEVSEISGELEKRMIEVVSLASRAGDQMEYNGNTYSIAAGPYLSLEDLLTVVFEGEKRFPRSWLMEEVVGKQAVELGFGELGKHGREKVFKFFDNTRNRLDVDKAAIDQMYKDLWQNQPLLGPELHSQIDYIIVTKIKDKSFFL